MDVITGKERKHLVKVMPTYEHKKVMEQLIALDELPSKREELVTWVKAGAHLEFLKNNAHSPEIVIYASPEYSFIHSMAVAEELLEPLDKDDLMKWSKNPFVSAASYVWGGGRDEIWVERGDSGIGSAILAKGTRLIYGRTFEGWNGVDRNYFELSQEYAHLEGLHWRPEQRGYCRFDENGDLLPVVSITMPTSGINISLVTFVRSSLDTYLAASNQVLVRLFDFTLLNRSSFSGWGDGEEQMFDNSDKIFYKQKVSGPSAYTRGVQIIRPIRPKSEIFSAMKIGGFGTDEKNHLEFIAYDWRNGRVSKISTDPEASTNYFEAEHNNLPYELSPAFFKPEVLLKYKGDKDKYTVGERDIHCRAAWFLEAFAVNDSFLILTQLINEGFVVKVIREQLRTNGISFNDQEASLSLLEKLIDFNNKSDDKVKLNGLRTAQIIRTKTKGHSAKNDAEQLALRALSEFETYASHFRHICEEIHDELQIIQDQFDIVETD